MHRRLLLGSLPALGALGLLVFTAPARPRHDLRSANYFGRAHSSAGGVTTPVAPTRDSFLNYEGFLNYPLPLAALPDLEAQEDMDAARLAADTLGNLPTAQPLPGSLPAALSARLDRTFAGAAQSSQAHSLSAALALPGQGIWSSRSGSRSPLFYWASAGKQAIAVLVLQLAEEGKLKLSDPISRWLDRVPNGDAITLEQLLSHTSGLYSANEYPSVRESGRPLEAEEELRILREVGSLFPAGTRWAYSNSGYNLLARVVERIEGRTWAASLRSRIIEPLHLQETAVVTPDLAEAEVAPPWTGKAQKPVNIHGPGAAGPLVASAADMLRFEQALLDGQLLQPGSRQAMFRTLHRMFKPGLYYGLGVMVYDLPQEGRRISWIGHSGGGPGVTAVAAYDSTRKAFVAVALNGDSDAHTVARLLLETLDVTAANPKG